VKPDTVVDVVIRSFLMTSVTGVSRSWEVHRRAVFAQRANRGDWNDDGGTWRGRMSYHSRATSPPDWQRRQRSKRPSGTATLATIIYIVRGPRPGRIRRLVRPRWESNVIQRSSVNVVPPTAHPNVPTLPLTIHITGSGKPPNDDRFSLEFWNWSWGHGQQSGRCAKIHQSSWR